METFILMLLFGCALLIGFACLVEYIDKKFTAYLKDKKEKSNNYYQPKI